MGTERAPSLEVLESIKACVDCDVTKIKEVFKSQVAINEQSYNGEQRQTKSIQKVGSKSLPQ